MENVKIKEGSGQGEKTAIHLMNPPTVIFDMADFEKAPEDIQNILILHEFFSALGMNDEFFQHTIGLTWALSLPLEMQSQLKNHESFIRYWKPHQKTNTLYSVESKEGMLQGFQFQLVDSSGDSGGGTTSIGGAGDLSSADIKLNLLNGIKNYFDKMSDPLNRHNDVKFFIFQQILNAKVYTNMNYGLGTLIHRDTGKLEITENFVKLEFTSNDNFLNSINLNGFFYRIYFINTENLLIDKNKHIEIREAILEQLLHELLSKFKIIGPG